MRGLVVAAVFLVVADTAALAADALPPIPLDFSFEPPPPQLSLNGPDMLFATQPRDDVWSASRVKPPPSMAAGINLGDLRVESGVGPDGKPAIARYQLDGTSILGGNVSGSLDSRGAKIELKWQSKSGKSD
ncbi:MAG: hypothetical protein GC166_12485 [Alphaproteobacteria bacterium]|nr:hypothetical protein [Alphaproteobacteria bacterium]